MAKSYFAILGISPDATGEEVKSAFRKLAKEFHPDHYAGGNERFRQIQEAYAVLADRRKRREYEQSIRQTRPMSVHRTVAGSHLEPLIPRTDMFPPRFRRPFTRTPENLLARPQPGFSLYSRAEPVHFENPVIEIALTPQQARRGGTARILLPTRSVCPACDGSGARGWYACPRCNGRGAVTAEIPLAAPFPAGLDEDHAVFIPLDQYGMAGSRLTVLFRVRPDRAL